MRRLVTLIGTALLAGTVLVVGTAPAHAAGNGKPVERPYREWALVSDDGLAHEVIATHIGRAQNTDVSVTISIDPTGTCVNSDGTETTPFIIDMAGTLVAPDGSALHYAGVLQFCPETGVIGTWDVIGGTGRFEGATGTMTQDGAHSVGTITY